MSQQNKARQYRARIQEYIEGGDFQRARAVCRKLVKLDHIADSWALLASINGPLGHLDQVVYCANKALKLDPHQISARYNLGMALHKLGDLEGARRALDQAARLQPGNADIQTMLGHVYKDLQQLEAAAGYYRQARMLDPGRESACTGLGVVLIGMGHLDEAREALQRALELKPDSMAAQYHLAFINSKSRRDLPMVNAVAGFFDDFSERFDHHLVDVLGYKFPEQVLGLVQGVLGADVHDLNILDVGCGTGLCGIALRGIAQTLTGVDLSPKMIEQALDRSVYDKLVVGDLLVPLTDGTAKFDLIVAGDVFVYVGELRDVFSAFRKALRPGGLFVFTTESIEGEGFELRATGRYAHSENYVRELCASSGLVVHSIDEIVIRTQYHRAIPGHAYILKAVGAVPTASQEL